MIAFKNPITSVLSRIVLSGVVVAAIFSVPVQARESRAADRHAEHSMELITPRVEGNRHFAAPSVHASMPGPSDQPGGICDRGDDPMIC